MVALEIMEDLFFIERGYLNANHFVYRSEKPILIDTGYISDFHVTQRLIEEIGTELSDTRLIISTHTHCDHIGGNKTIQDRSECDIALHKHGKHFIDTRDDWATWWRYYGQEAEFFNCTKPLNEGEIIAIGPHEFQVIYTPGHASDGIVLYNRKGKALISGDALWEDDIPTITMRVEGSTCLFNLMESLEKLERLDVEIVYPGHGKAFADFRGALSRSKRKARAYMDHKEKSGADLLKKIFIYTLLMHGQVDEDRFFSQLMETYWFKETVDLYFESEYQEKYDDVMRSFFRRGIIKRKNGKIFTMVKP